MYIEIEFRDIGSQHKCDQDLPPIHESDRIIQITEDYMEEKVESVHTVQHNFPAEQQDKSGKEMFFHQQLYYINDFDDSSEYEIQVELSQKFIDQSTVVPWIEVLETGIDYDDVRPSKYYSERPQCSSRCVLAGHKSYNQFTLSSVIPSWTLFRVWLHISTPALYMENAKLRDTCSNYAINVKALSTA